MKLIAGLASIATLATLATPAAAEFDDIPFTTRNFDTFVELNSTFVCRANLLDRAVTGCTTTDAGDVTEYTEAGSDWRETCMGDLNDWNRDPGNTLSNVVLKELSGDGLTFGCTIKLCDGEDPEDYDVATTDDGSRTAVVLSNFYCGAPPEGMTVVVGEELTENPSANIANLERGVERIFTARYHSTSTSCAHMVDKSVVCWGDIDLSGLGLESASIEKVSIARQGAAFLLTNGNIIVGGDATLGGSFNNAEAATKAVNGLNVDLDCNMDGNCVAIQSDGSGYRWGRENDGALPAAVTSPSSPIVAIYSSFRGHFFVHADGSGTPYGSGQYGGIAPASDVLNGNITKVAVSHFFGFGIITEDGRGLSWGGVGATQLSSAPIDDQLTSGVVDVEATFSGVIFRKSNNTALVAGHPDIATATPIANVSRIFGGYVTTSFAVEYLDGSLEAFGSSGRTGTIDDGTTYLNCKDSTDNILCFNDQGRVTKLMGDYTVPASAETGVTALYGGRNGLAALKGNPGELVIIGDVQPDAREERELTDSVVFASGSFNGWSAVRGQAVAETQFPTLAPTSSPTPEPTPPFCGCRD